MKILAMVEEELEEKVAEVDAPPQDFAASCPAFTA